MSAHGQDRSALELAEAAADAVRELVHATSTAGRGAADPDEVGAILERVRTMLGDLPQLTRQLHQRLNERSRSLRTDQGGDPAAAIATVGTAAAVTAQHANPRTPLITALDEAVNAAKSLARRENAQ